MAWGQRAAVSVTIRVTADVTVEQANSTGYDKALRPRDSSTVPMTRRRTRHD